MTTKEDLATTSELLLADDTDDVVREKKFAEAQILQEDKPKLSFKEKAWKELRPEKKLIPIKILAFLFFGGMFSVTPYFTLHMQQLGISVKEIAIIYSILPIPAILGPVISGLVADYVSNFKAILVANIVLTILFNVATVFTPTMDPHDLQVLSFNSSGLALSLPDCLSDGQTIESLGDPWICSSPCFNSTELFSAGKQTLYCSAVDRSLPLPLSDCHIAMAGEADCGYVVWFSPTLSRGSAYMLQRDSSVYTSDFCPVTCTAGSPSMVDDNYMSNSKTFWIYFILRILVTLFMNAAFTMMDASIMAVMLRTGGDYGKQRLVAMLSMATFPFVASCIVQGLSDGPADYSYVIYLHALLLGLSGFVALFINLDVEKQDNSNMLKDVVVLMKKTEVLIFMCIIFLLGANWGYLENYLFVFLNSLDAPTYLLGLTMTFGCLTGVPMLLVSDRIVEKLGRERVFFIGFLAYTVRMFGYSIISNPWYCFIFEALEVFTYQIMWVASVTYFPILAPTSLLGTLTGIAGAVHYNIGRGGGALVGGLLIARIGMVWTFRAFGISSFIFALIYLALQKLGPSKFLATKGPTEPDGANLKDIAA